MKKLISAICLLFIFLLFTGAVKDEIKILNYYDPDYIEISEISANGISSFRDYADRVIFVKENSLYVVELDEEINIITEDLEENVITSRFDRKGELLYLIYNAKGDIGIKTIDLSTLEIVNAKAIDKMAIDLDYIAITENQKIVYQLGESNKKLFVYSIRTGLSEELKFDKPIKSMLTYGNYLYVVSDNVMHIYSLEGTNAVKKTKQEADFIMAAVFGANSFGDVTGKIRKFEDNTEIYTNKTEFDIESFAGARNQNVSLDEKNGYNLKSAANTFITINESGEITKAYFCPDKISQIGKYGVLVSRDNKLCYAKNSSFTLRETKPETNIPEDWNIKDDKYIVFSESRKVQELCEESGGEMFNSSGEKLSSGSIKTGDKLEISDKGYTIILLGDVNCNGKVNSADFELIEEMLIGKISLKKMQVISADVDEGGTVGTEDLVAFRKTYL